MAQGLEKLETAETFLETAELLEIAPHPPFIGESIEETDAREHRLRFRKKKACHFLYAIIFELAIKIIWEVENGRESEYIHNILQIYNELSCEKQSKIKEMYETQASLIKSQEAQNNEDRIRVNDWTEFQSLEDALEANYATVRDFKHDGVYRGKSSVIGGVIWNNVIEELWIVPYRFVVFPKALVEYARECVESQLT